jgi:hypothetical protein
MALFQWKCDSCGKFERKILDKRPPIDKCQCGGLLSFVTSINAMVMETIDNGVMVKKLERLNNVEELLKERNDVAEKPDSEVI